jgi:trk system potassium uptake protein
MRIVLAGGSNEADFLIRMFKKKSHHLIVINDNVQYCEYLASTHEVDVFFGDPSKEYVLLDSGIQNADVLIALTSFDADNLVICQFAKRVFGVKKCVSIVANPKNVELFKKLGINHAISSTYLVAQNIERVSIIDNLVQSLSLDNDRIVITEIELNERSHLISKQLKDVSLPINFNISCIFRGPEVIIPNGNTTFTKHDRLVLVSLPQDQDVMIDYIQSKEEKYGK